VLGGNIPVAAFFNMNYLEELVILGDEVLISNYAFEGLTNTEIYFPNLLDAGNALTIQAGSINQLMMNGSNANGLIDNSLNTSYPNSQTINLSLSITSVASGVDFILIASTNGEVYGKGQNGFGQLGLPSIDANGTTTFTKLSFANLQTAEKVYTVFTGYQHAGVISSSRRVFIWGNNTYGQLGLGHTNSVNIPTLLNVPTTPAQLSLGFYHSLMKGQNNQVYAWGRNDLGQVGDSTLVNKLTPTLISFPSLNSGESIATVRAGETFSMALTNQGRVYAWGSNLEGQLAAPLALSRSILPRPVVISGLQPGETIINIQAGPRTAYALTNRGRIIAWGSNLNEELKTSSSTFSNIPTVLSLLNEELEDVFVTQLAAGYDHVIAIGEDNQLYSWGNNTYGQLG
jgi:alpha-tubulin suppressor-like RCC1 family protein